MVLVEFHKTITPKLLLDIVNPMLLYDVQTDVRIYIIYSVCVYVKFHEFNYECIIKY